MRGWLLILAVALPAAGPARAQPEDEQTSAHAEQDRRYLERSSAGPPEAEPDPPDLEAFLARAEQLLRDRHYRSTSSAHYYIQTDDVRLEIEEVAELLESFEAFFDRFWSSRLELASHDKPLRVLLFRSFYKYNQLLGSDFRFRNVRPKGHYLRAYHTMAAHTSADTPQQLSDALVHEAAHQLVDRRLFGPHGQASPWLSEGLASYFGYMYRDKHGVFTPERIGGKSVRLIRDAARGQSKEGVLRLRGFRRALRALDGVPAGLVDDVVRLQDPNAFYGGAVDRHYATSWLLVHYLLHGEEGRHAAAFVRYVELERRGNGGADALYRALGWSAERLERAFVRYVLRLTAR